MLHSTTDRYTLSVRKRLTRFRNLFSGREGKTEKKQYVYPSINIISVELKRQVRSDHKSDWKCAFYNMTIHDVARNKYIFPISIILYMYKNFILFLHDEFPTASIYITNNYKKKQIYVYLMETNKQKKIKKIRAYELKKSIVDCLVKLMILIRNAFLAN